MNLDEEPPPLLVDLEAHGVVNEPPENEKPIKVPITIVTGKS
jgi:hypothetical protein